MFTSTSIVQDFSICFRCQYRIAIRRRLKSGRRNRLLGTTHTRHIASDHCLLQNENLSVKLEQAQEEFFLPAQESSDGKPHPKIWGYGKSEDIYSTADLEMDALGEPAKIIMLGKTQNNSIFRAENAEDAIENHHVNISPTQILKNIQEEPALVGFEEASIHIENLRTSWLSQLQAQNSTLPKAKYLQLLNSLQEGFTLGQLVGYYEAKIAKLQESVFELARPYSSDLYSRSSWVPGCSPFPGKAADQLRYLKNRRLESNKENVDEKESIPQGLGAFKQALRTKNSVAEAIIQVLWSVKVPEEVGELDMWIDSIYFGILLSDRKSMFNRITETYKAKVVVSRSRKIIRITSYKNTCYDIFKSIFQTLENIHSVNIYLPPEPPEKLLRSDATTVLKDSLIQRIEHDTGTTIRRALPTTSKRKGGLGQYRIFYLGSNEDGLKSAKEELIEASQFTASKLPSVVWNDEECLQGRPRPIEVGSAMPMVARETKWSRWASPIKRNSEVPFEGKCPDLGQGCSESLLRSIFNVLFKPTTPSLSNHPKTHESVSWEESPKHQTFATFVQVLYPSEHLNALAQKLEAKKISLRSRTLQNSLYSQRQLFYGFPGLRFMLQNASPGTQVGEDLRIRLRPSPKALLKEGDGIIFPDVELRIKCDLATRTCEFSSARIILNQQEVDLLLPTEMADIRFCSMTRIFSGAKTDLQILESLSSSNINIFAQKALNFPDTLSLSIPPHLAHRPHNQSALRKSTQKFESVEDFLLEGGPDITVKYALSKFEHWSYMSGDIMGLNFKYAVISSGKTRKREELRVALDEEEEGPTLDVAAFMARFKVLSEMIARLRDVNQVKGNDSNIAASLVSDM